MEAHERGRALVEQVIRTSLQVAEYLEIPSSVEVWTAGGDAWRDGVEAAKSLSHFLFLVGRPFAVATWWICVTVGWFVWEHIIVNGLYNHGLSQTKEGALALWRFQRSLSREGLIIEGAVFASLVALYLLRRWLRRNRYIERARNMADRQFRQASKVRLSMFELRLSAVLFFSV